MKNYRLAIDGDSYEQKYWGLFIQNQFQSYEDFWIKNIVPLTNRPVDIHFKTDKELSQIGKTPNDICVAQLHYSTLRHLARVFDILNKTTPPSFDNLTDVNLTEGMVRLCSALDVAFELLERFQNPTEYDPWLEEEEKGVKGGREARKRWQKVNNNPLSEIRNYRNHLVHGRMSPKIIGDVYLLPKIGAENNYFDWRKITNPINNPGLDGNDLVPIRDILSSAWIETIKYLDYQWKILLLK